MEAKGVAKNNKLLSIIVKSPNEEVIYAETVKYTGQFKDLGSVRVHLAEQLKEYKTFFDGYDRRTRQKILAYNGKKRGKIDWTYDCDKASIDKMFSWGINNVTVVCVCYKEAVGLGGGAVGEASVGIVIDFIIKILTYVFCVVRDYLRPFRVLGKRYDVDEGFIREVVGLNKTWKVGFISSNDFARKRVVEYSIMGRMGYRKSDGKWTRSDNVLGRMPDEIIKYT